MNHFRSGRFSEFSSDLSCESGERTTESEGAEKFKRTEDGTGGDRVGGIFGFELLGRIEFTGILLFERTVGIFGDSTEIEGEGGASRTNTIPFSFCILRKLHQASRKHCLVFLGSTQSLWKVLRVKYTTPTTNKIGTFTSVSVESNKTCSFRLAVFMAAIFEFGVHGLRGNEELPDPKMKPTITPHLAVMNAYFRLLIGIEMEMPAHVEARFVSLDQIARCVLEQWNLIFCWHIDNWPLLTTAAKSDFELFCNDEIYQLIWIRAVGSDGLGMNTMREGNKRKTAFEYRDFVAKQIEIARSSILSPEAYFFKHQYSRPIKGLHLSSFVQGCVMNLSVPAGSSSWKKLEQISQQFCMNGIRFQAFQNTPQSFPNPPAFRILHTESQFGFQLQQPSNPGPQTGFQPLSSRFFNNDMRLVASQFL